MFCGALVCTPEEEELLTRESKKGQKFREKILRQYEFKVTMDICMYLRFSTNQHKVPMTENNGLYMRTICTCKYIIILLYTSIH